MNRAPHVGEAVRVVKGRLKDTQLVVTSRNTRDHEACAKVGSREMWFAYDELEPSE